FQPVFEHATGSENKCYSNLTSRQVEADTGRPDKRLRPMPSPNIDSARGAQQRAPRDRRTLRSLLEGSAAAGEGAQMRPTGLEWPASVSVRNASDRAGGGATVQRPAPIIVVAMPAFIVDPA